MSKKLPVHLMVGLADHFEPAIQPQSAGRFADYAEQERRLDRWCCRYPGVVSPCPDDDGRPFRHTYFYPAEQYHSTLLDRLEDHCRSGWGELEIQLHHGVGTADSAKNTKRTLLRFRDALADRGCLARLDGSGPPRFAFVHGNWALANSDRGRFCGVDDEMQILADVGCYADFTLPSAPSFAQTGKINELYECSMPLNLRAPHRWGRHLRCGRPPKIFPLIIHGPLLLDFSRRRAGLPLPKIENGEITAVNPPTMQRLRLWQGAGIAVEGRSEWIFVKLHCHGMDPRDDAMFLGGEFQQFLRDLISLPPAEREYRVHFVTAREMVNIMLAACDGHDGNPGLYRDYRLQLFGSSD